jgi:glucose/arabinose dehydrogenase
MDPIRTWSLLATVVALAACGGGGGDAPAPAPEPPPPLSPPPTAVTLTSGLVNPWSLAFLPDGSMLVTERPGRLRRVSADGATVSAPIAGVPAVAAGGQGGLFDVVPDPGFAANRRLYLSYAEPGTGAEAGRNGTAVARATLGADGTALADVEVIFRQTPKVASSAHFGGRLVPAPGGVLYVTLGERSGEAARAQDLAAGHGKVMRIRTDGSVPGDNPFAGTAGAQPEIYSLGHRNPQGAALHPATGELWLVEHGPQGGDELNRIRPGLNYGWPRVSYGCAYGSTPVDRCTPVGGASTGPGFEPPVSHWVPLSIAPSGMVFYTGDRFPEWQGNVFVGALAGQALWRLTMNGNEVVAREAMFASLGERIRDVRQGPDGWLYLLTDASNGRIVRIER